jgi:hypothetical protein
MCTHMYCVCVCMHTCIQGFEETEQAIKKDAKADAAAAAAAASADTSSSSMSDSAHVRAAIAKQHRSINLESVIMPQVMLIIQYIPTAS